MGDPHLTNMYGQHFDLYLTGVSVLLQIPRWSGRGRTMLRLEAEARRMGGACSDVYFQVVTISGIWTGRTGRIRFFADKSKGKPNSTKWMRFGKADVKVVHGKTQHGINYLNVLAKNLARAGFPVGGLLGGDDHTAATAKPSKCTRTLSL